MACAHMLTLGQAVQVSMFVMSTALPLVNE